MPDEKKTIPAQDWGNDEAGFELAETQPGDGSILFSVDHKDARTVAWAASVQQAREIAASLAQRADLIDPPSRRKLGDVPNTPTGIIGEELRVLALLQKHIFETFRDPDGHHRISRLTDGFAIVALMAELEQVAPDRAAKVAEQLADCWIDGASVHEFIVQWFDDYAAGRPVGFNPPPVLPLAITRATP